ncbi:MAG: hypothetical protein ABI882_07170 [Acidobacteriota bacterium]
MANLFQDEGSDTPTAKWAKTILRYGLLLFILALLARDLWALQDRPRPYTSDPFSSLVISLLLLFNHIAFSFPWRRNVRNYSSWGHMHDAPFSRGLLAMDMYEDAVSLFLRTAHVATREEYVRQMYFVLSRR